MDKQWSFRGTHVDSGDILLIAIPLSLKKKIKASLIVSTVKRTLTFRHQSDIILYCYMPWNCHFLLSTKDEFQTNISGMTESFFPDYSAFIFSEALTFPCRSTAAVFTVCSYCSPVHQLIASFDAFNSFPNCDFDFCQVWWALQGLWD